MSQHHFHVSAMNGISTVGLLLSVAAAFATVADGAMASDNSEVTWLVRLLFGGMLLLNGYFLKQSASKFEKQTERVRANTDQIRMLTQIARVVLTALVTGAAGHPEVGRRQGDPLLATLLHEIEQIEESNAEDRNKL